MCKIKSHWMFSVVFFMFYICVICDCVCVLKYAIYLIWPRQFSFGPDSSHLAHVFLIWLIHWPEQKMSQRGPCVPCLAHTINLAVQKALKVSKRGHKNSNNKFALKCFENCISCYKKSSNINFLLIEVFWYAGQKQNSFLFSCQVFKQTPQEFGLSQTEAD